jgi:hypothetical protein
MKNWGFSDFARGSSDLIQIDSGLGKSKKGFLRDLLDLNRIPHFYSIPKPLLILITSRNINLIMSENII